MTSKEERDKQAGRAPAVFRTDDPNLRITAPASGEQDRRADDLVSQALQTPHRHRTRWGALFLTALGGLFSLAAGLWLTQFVGGLFSRDDWIGWTAVALLGLAALAALMIAAGEIAGLMRIRRMNKIRRMAGHALQQADRSGAAPVLAALKSLYGGRAQLRWAMARLTEHEHDIRDGREILVLSERELLAPLDGEARSIIAASAKRVSVVTAISPAALIDVGFVAFENLRLLRLIATVYGGRPGMVGLLRIARMVVSHLTITGGLALSSDLIQQMIGQKLTAKISARLGEGLVNGALTARIGIAALHICRPLPFLEARPPRFRDFLAEIVRTRTNDEAR
jgi:putative membrane protein